MRARRLLFALPAVAAALFYGTPAVAAATFTVNTNDDGDAVCTAAHCSLREAIEAANAAAGHDQIVFAIPPGGPQTIRPVARSLPPVTDPVTIDATTQPGFAGTPIVELDGSLAGPGAVGFDVPAGGSVLTGFAIDGFGFGLGGAGTGFAIRLAGAGGSTIEGNYVGTDLTGAAAPRRNDFGIFVDSVDNVIGGTTAAKRNVISGNGDGVHLRGAATRNQIIGNYVGTDAGGTQIVGNSVGVHVNNDAGGNAIGGSNLISGNSIGVMIDFAGPDSVVQGNLIGTTVSGLAALSVIGQTGVLVSSSSRIVIGGAATSDRNVISGNQSGGVVLQGSGNVVGSNYIGVGVDGSTAVPNGSVGVSDDVGGNTIGAAFPGSGVQSGPNVIAFNTQGGVAVRNGVGSPILGNSIYANGGLGIDLYPLGPSPNDPGDADAGPNDLQNAPVLTSASTSNGSVEVDGTLSSHPDTTYVLQFFANVVCDELGFGEGQELLAERSVTTDATGTAAFSFSLGSGSVGNVITATATDPGRNTSEFSNCENAIPTVSGSVTTLSPLNAVNPVGTSHTVTATVVGGTVQQLLAGITVFFTVSGSVTTSGQCTTDGNGRCSFTYGGPELPGADLIEAFADANGNGTQDATELSGLATKEWVLPAASPGQATGGGQIIWVSGKVVFGFNAQNRNGRLDGNCNVIDVATRTHIKCRSVTSLVIVGTHATIFGEATVNGTATTYRIDVDDLGEPGVADTFRIQLQSGYNAAGILTAGNIQVRP